MAIFNSYVKLPEGKGEYLISLPGKKPHGTRSHFEKSRPCADCESPGRFRVPGTKYQGAAVRTWPVRVINMFILYMK